MTIIKKADWALFVIPVLLTCIGLVSIYSSSLGGGGFLNLEKQIIFLAAGIILMFLLAFLDWRAIRDNSYLILALYIVFVLALAGLLVFAPFTRGVRGWYRIGPVSIDPVEIVKLVLIILLAKYFSKRHVETYRLKHILLSGFYVLIPFLLVIRQPDLGSGLVLLGLWIGILIISGIKLRHFLVLTLCGLLLVLLAWFFFLEDYQKERIVSFIAPEIDPQGASWSQTQSRIAIGSGGVFGKGIGKGSQTRYGFLPEPHTDFIFAAVAEEGGMTGVVVLLSLFLLLIWRLIRIALVATSNFPRLFASGLAIIIVVQLFIHIGMNLAILPVIGVSLPLVSYGGSGLLITYISLGIAQSTEIH